MIRNVLFDMNGVIVANEMFHERLLRSLLEAKGLYLSAGEFNRTFHGRTDQDGFAALAKDYALSESVSSLIHQKMQREAAFLEESIVEVPGAGALIKLLSNHFILGLVSSASRIEVDLVVKKLNLSPYFKVTVSGNDVLQGKPHPEPYALAARTLKAQPSQCIVIEDAANGVLSARAAGMKCIALGDAFVEADARVTHLKEISLEMLEGL